MSQLVGNPENRFCRVAALNILNSRKREFSRNCHDRNNLSRILRKPGFCLCENSNCEADQRLYFRYTDSTTSLLLKSESSRLQPLSMAAQAGLCQTGWKPPGPVFSRRGLFHVYSLFQSNWHATEFA